MLLRAMCYAGIRYSWRRGFQSGVRDKAWLLEAFCGAKFYSSIVETGKASDMHIRRGQKECSIASF